MRHYPLQMPPGAGLVADEMFGCPDRALSELPVVRVRSTDHQIVEGLSYRECGAVQTISGVIEVQATQRPQLILHVAKAPRDIECLRECRAHLRGIRRRCAERGVQLHRFAWVRVSRGFENGQSLLSTRAAFFKQRQ